ncbi:MAG: hypothetical protein GX601_04695 [Anaerolineales bacterium]|nr:hypothetical protein [Anaerolineales bacterium]
MQNASESIARVSSCKCSVGGALFHREVGDWRASIEHTTAEVRDAVRGLYLALG